MSMKASTCHVAPFVFTDSSHVDLRQCLIYDSPHSNARLIGVEYMISATLHKTLDSAERKLWHSHVFEVKSGMLIMPGPEGVPTGVWEGAETKAMEVSKRKDPLMLPH